MDNATFQTPTPLIDPVQVPLDTNPKPKRKLLWVLLILVIAGIAIGFISLYGKGGVYKGALQVIDKVSIQPSTPPAKTTTPTDEQRAALDNARKAVSEAEAAANEAKQASQEAERWSQETESFAAKAREAKTTDEEADILAEKAQEAKQKAEEARDRAFAARDRASDARNNARSAAQNAGINADQFLADSGANDAVNSANSSAGEAQASVLQAEQSANEAIQIADEKARQAEEKEPAGEKPVVEEKAPIAAIPIPGEKEKPGAEDAGEVPVPGEKPAEGEQFTGFFQFLLNEAKNLSTQEERQKAINILSAVRQAAQEGRIEDAKELLKQAENLINSSKSKDADAKQKLAAKEKEKVEEVKKEPVIVPAAEQPSEQQLRNEIDRLTQLYREAIANNAAQADQYRQQLEIALAALQQQTGQPVNVTVQLPSGPALTPSCPSGFNYDPSRNVCIQAQTQEVVVSRGAGAGGTGAATPSSVTSTAPTREVVLGRTQAPSREIQAEEEEEEAQTRELEEASRAAAAEKPTAKAKAAGEESALRGAYVEGRIAGETGPGLLVYPVVLAGANLLYYLRKRKKK